MRLEGRGAGRTDHQLAVAIEVSEQHPSSGFVTKSCICCLFFFFKFFGINENPILFLHNFTFCKGETSTKSCI
jgi:hypothetical protein